jgi:hypothetical protein
VERRAIKEVIVGNWLSSVEMIQKVVIVEINIAEVHGLKPHSATMLQNSNSIIPQELLLYVF